MKTKTTLLLLLISISSLGQSIEFNDPAFKANLISNVGLNTDGNDEIDIAEANAFTGDLRVSYMSDLSGIEYFTNLNKLECYYSTLTSLDLSQNTMLTNIRITWTPIKALDVSNCSLLEHLQVFETNITTLDVSENQALQSLECNGNDLLQVLNVSNNPDLIAIYCSYCSLEELDVTSCTSLLGLDCRNNNLKSLDMRNGNNLQITSTDNVRLSSNNSLTCVSVDNPEFSDEMWLDKSWVTVYSSNCLTGIQERQRISNNEISAVYDLRGARVDASRLRIKGFYLIKSKDGRTEKRVVSNDF